VARLDGFALLPRKAKTGSSDRPNINPREKYRFSAGFVSNLGTANRWIEH
jgi:hypothetical protein